MARLDGIWWSESGDGPVVVVPCLNLGPSDLDLSSLTERFRVVWVAPRGFGRSGRPGSYPGTCLVDDVERVVDHLGIGHHATFGYSMNGAMAARLAVGNPRVTAVACLGFPLTADLSAMGERARGRNAAARQDPETWVELVAAHDPAAVVAFWDDIGQLPPAALASVGCPVRAWWGEQDEVLASLVAPEALERDLASHGIAYDVVPGLDHVTMLHRLDVVLPDVASWLADAASPSPAD